MPKVISLYVFCSGKTKYERRTPTYRKERGVFTRIKVLCDELQDDVRLSENALTPIRVIPSSSTTELNKLDSSFMYSQLLKEILLNDNYDDHQRTKLVNFCRIHYVGNTRELNVIDEFKRKYPHPSAIWWYTRECFLYRMLNKALRTQDIEVIIKMGFVVRDLHQHIEQLHLRRNRQSFIVYRGQGMLQTDLEKIQNNEGGLSAFLEFLSTSTSKEIALNFARSSREKYDLLAILFEITIDLAHSTTPFAFVDSDGYYKDREEEVLFSMHTVFRIGETRQIEAGLFQINLTLTDDNDPQLAQLTQHMREATRGQTSIHRLGSLMIAMGEFNNAVEIYTSLFDTISHDDKKGLAFLHHQLGLIKWEQRDLPSALFEFQQSLDIYSVYLSLYHPQLSSIYSNIAVILQEQGDLDSALKHLKLALNIDLQVLRSRKLNIDLHALQNIATRYNNIGLVLTKQSNYDEALKSYDRALEIELTHLPPLHPILATTYNNIGLVHHQMGNNISAHAYYQKTLTIFDKSLPSNHLSLAITRRNIAYVLDGLDRTQEAIKYIEQAINIIRLSFGTDHPQEKEYQQHLNELRRKV